MWEEAHNDLHRALQSQFPDERYGQMPLAHEPVRVILVNCILHNQHKPPELLIKAMIQALLRHHRKVRKSPASNDNARAVAAGLTTQLTILRSGGAYRFVA